MTDLIQKAGIRLDVTASSPAEAVRICGELLMELGAISQEYADAMREREKSFSSAVGKGLAIPHGTADSRQYVLFDQLVFLRLVSPIPWGEQDVRCVLGIAAKGDSHVNHLVRIADLIQDKQAYDVLMNSTCPHEVWSLVNDK